MVPTSHCRFRPEQLKSCDFSTQVGAVRTVCILAAMTAGLGFEDGEPEDMLDDVLSSLEVGAGRVMN